MSVNPNRPPRPRQENDLPAAVLPVGIATGLAVLTYLLSGDVAGAIQVFFATVATIRPIPRDRS